MGGLRSGRWTDPVCWRLAARLRRQGRTLGEIGRRLGVSHKAVQKMLRKYGLAQPTFSIPQILAWADAFHAQAGYWPKRDSGRIPGTLSESWRTVENALRYGLRGLPGGSSLARLLAEHRGVRNVRDLPELTLAGILAWADAYQQQTGRWPNENSGPISGAPGEDWRNVDMALRLGRRGLPGGSTLARLLAATRGVRNRASIPPLTVEQILAWADTHRERTGRWPNREAGPVVGAPEETWSAVAAALRQGYRGLPAGGSLARLLAEHRDVCNRGGLPAAPGTPSGPATHKQP